MEICLECYATGGQHLPLYTSHEKNLLSSLVELALQDELAVLCVQMLPQGILQFSSFINVLSLPGKYTQTGTVRQILSQKGKWSQAGPRVQIERKQADRLSSVLSLCGGRRAQWPAPGAAQTAACETSTSGATKSSCWGDSGAARGSWSRSSGSSSREYFLL